MADAGHGRLNIVQRCRRLCVDIPNIQNDAPPVAPLQRDLVNRLCRSTFALRTVVPGSVHMSRAVRR